MTQQRHFGMIPEGYKPKLWCFLKETAEFETKRWWWRKKKNVEKAVFVVLVIALGSILVFF